MAKYGRRLSFGFSPRPTAADPKRPLELAKRAEVLDFDYVTIQEDAYDAANLDAWTLLTAIGMVTSRISLVATSPLLVLHSPVLLAKAVASLDLLTGGRVAVGLSCDQISRSFALLLGDERDEQHVFGALEESMQLMRRIWQGSAAIHFRGEAYQLNGLQTGPSPSREIGIWLSGSEPKSLEIVGRLADGWMPRGERAMQLSDLLALSKAVDEAAESIGRQPSAIRRILNIGGIISDHEGAARFHGNVRQWAEELAELAVDAGIDTFVLVEGDDTEAQMEKFAREVMPYMRELIGLSPDAPIVSGLVRSYQGAAASGATPAEEATDDVDLVDEVSMESFPASDPPASASFE